MRTAVMSEASGGPGVLGRRRGGWRCCAASRSAGRTATTARCARNGGDAGLFQRGVGNAELAGLLAQLEMFGPGLFECVFALKNFSVGGGEFADDAFAFALFGEQRCCCGVGIKSDCCGHRCPLSLTGSIFGCRDLQCSMSVRHGVSVRYSAS